MSISRSASSLFAALLLAGCAGALDAFEHDPAFLPERVAAGRFTLLAYRRFAPGADTLTVYVEGDGAPWAGRDRPPADPTPAASVAQRLALADRRGSVAWLARPCQFLSADALAACDSRYWRRARYGEEVVAAANEAIGALLRESGARRLVLVGHSGGGAVAALVAARRVDVALLVTVGGVLDTARWTALHGVTPLDQSLNPADASSRLAGLRQVHYVGEEDRVTPPALAEGYARQVGPSARIVRVAGRDHDCCWERDWPRILARLAEET